MTEETVSRIAGFLGLCTRAGQLSFGQEACVSKIRKQEAALVLLDEGCSQNTQKRFADACTTHPTPLYHMPAGRIAQAVGKDGRMVVAIGHGGMAQKLLALLQGEASRPQGGQIAEDEKDRGKEENYSHTNGLEIQSVKNAGVQGVR